LFIEFFTGSTLSNVGIFGIFLLVAWAYFIDVGEFKWRIPSSLLLIMSVVTLIYGSWVYAVDIASRTVSPWVVSFYQYSAIFALGVLLFLLVKPFREGFIFRIRKQGKVFLGASSINESLAQGSYIVGNYAIAMAPIAAYASALSGINSIFVLVLFYFFPQREIRINRVQITALVMMVVGGFILQIAS
jgi:hypothetical protein